MTNKEDNMFICRCWTETSAHGWLSYFKSFDTEEEAHEFGRLHLQYIAEDELSREYEVYKLYKKGGSVNGKELHN